MTKVVTFTQLVYQRSLLVMCYSDSPVYNNMQFNGYIVLINDVVGQVLVDQSNCTLGHTKLITWSSDSPTPFLQGHNFSKKIFPPTRQISRPKKNFFFQVPLKIFHCCSSIVICSNVDYSVLMYKNIYLRIKGND